MNKVWVALLVATQAATEWDIQVFDDEMNAKSYLIKEGIDELRRVELDYLARIVENARAVDVNLAYDIAWEALDTHYKKVAFLLSLHDREVKSDFSIAAA